MVFPTALFAENWIDGWIKNNMGASTVNSAGPAYYESQKRGYVTPGSVSARWISSGESEYLFSAAPPKFSAGCGGIDVFLGSFSMMDPEYLVQKFEKIIQAAPAAAFDIALNTLCEQCTNTMKSLENITSKLNSLQLDSCRASKALVATIAEPMASGDNKKELSNMITDFEQSTGASDLYYGVVEEFQGDQAEASGNMLAQCPAKIKSLFKKGSFLENASNEIGMNSGLSDLMRGMIGDIKIDIHKNVPSTTYIPPCTQNNNLLESFLNGNAHIQTLSKKGSYQCQEVKDTHRNIRKYIEQKLSQIMKRMKQKSRLSLQDEQFITALHAYPITPILKAAVSSGNEDMVLHQVASLSAKLYTFRLLQNIIESLQTLRNEVRFILSKEGQSSSKCQVGVFADTTDHLKLIGEKSQHLSSKVHTSYMNTIQEYQAIKEQISDVKQLRTVSSQAIKLQFDIR